MNTYFQRYQQGDYQGVWHNLLLLSDQVRQEPVFSDAWAVAKETMARVRKNLESLAHRLQSMGYQFRNPDSVISAPPPDIKDKINCVEEQTGVLPLSLRAFYEVVGSVDFTGGHPDWTGCEYPDPLVVESIESALYELEEWKQNKEEYERAFGSFRIPIAPDYYHKEDVSGGMWYSIALPNLAVDAVLLEEWHNTTFVEYLRVCLQWGGFPRLERVRSTITWPVAQLVEGLLEL